MPSDDAEQFFETYTRAFDDFDGCAIAALYCVPCAISDGDGEQFYSGRQGLEQKFSANCQAMRELAYRRAEFRILHEQKLGGSAMAVTVLWLIHTDKQPIEFGCHYVFHSVAGQWRIFAANVYAIDAE